LGDLSAKQIPSLPAACTRRWSARRWVAICAVVIALVAMLVGVAHAPFVRAGVLSWALARLRTDAGLRVEIGDLDYNSRI
jgi:hypothetical protein